MNSFKELIRTDFKEGDVVINHSRNGAKYRLTTTDLIRFLDEDLELLNKKENKENKENSNGK